MPAIDSHYWMCHPADDEAPDKPMNYVPQDTEECWHCGVMVDVGCYCLACAYYGALTPPGTVYHCKGCGRWWAYSFGLFNRAYTFSGND